MKTIVPLLAVMGLALIAYIGTSFLGLHMLFGIVMPYLAFGVFVGGFIFRILDWMKSPVPFRIPTTTGQSKSLEWIKQDQLESPSGFWSAFARVMLEVLFFRSLFRNTKAELGKGPTLVYSSSKWLWFGGLVFHWTMLVIFLRHYRFFLAPIPHVLQILERVDSFLQVTLPALYLTDLFFVLSLAFFLSRRWFDAQTKYISLASDFFPLFLLLAIALSGISMRHFTKIDVAYAKLLMQGLISFQPVVPGPISGIFYVHLFLVCVLAAYFPFSKLMHMGGIFLSPTRNLATNSREIRHVNPWNAPEKIRTYTEYEDEFREKMAKADLPLERKT